MERQRGHKLYPRAAPEENLLRSGGLLCLHRAPWFGYGGVLRIPMYRDCGLLKQIPTAPNPPFQSARLIQIFFSEPKFVQVLENIYTDLFF